MNENTATSIVVPVIVLSIVALIVLFSGDPDLMDAILFRLTEGAIPLPK